MPVENIKIALLPLDIIPFDPKANISNVIDRLKTIQADTNLIILPEMFTSGFTPDRQKMALIAQPTDSPILDTLHNYCNQTRQHICGSLTVADGSDSNLVNRGFFISPDQPIQFYDKHHLFSHGGENRVLKPGKHPSPTVEINSWRIRMAICYDIRFPVWNRARANDYDLLIVPANWTHARSYPWHQMMIARAIENQIFVAGCNRTGHDYYGDYEITDTIVYDNWGKPTGHLSDNGIYYATLDADRFTADRKRFAPWHDADQFDITL